MNKIDPLRSLLREWEVPEPSQALDTSMRDAFRQMHTPSIWNHLWRMQVSVPVPILAAAVLVVMIALMIQFRSNPSSQRMLSFPQLATRIDAPGFQPLPNGNAQIVLVKEFNK
jgi:hypothetical protein